MSGPVDLPAWQALLQHQREVLQEHDVDDRALSHQRRAYACADDAAFGDRRIEHARLAVLRLQAFGAAEHAAEVAHVLAVHDNVGVAFEHHVHRRAQRLDHAHRRFARAHGRVVGPGLDVHAQTPSCWRWRLKCSGMSL